MKLSAATIGLLMLVGYAITGCTAKLNARDSVQQSLEVYQYCLSEHAQDPSPCDEARRIYEDDLRAYKAMSQDQP